MSGSDWDMFRYDLEHTGETSDIIKNPKELKLIWKFETGSSVDSSPAISENFVYVGSDDNYIYCLNKNTGELIWKFETGSGVYSSPAISENFVYVGSYDSYIYCFGDPLISERLKKLEKELLSLETNGFDNEVNSIKSKIKNSENILEIENDISELKSKIDDSREREKIRLQKQKELYEKLHLLDTKDLKDFESDVGELKLRIEQIRNAKDAAEIDEKINEVKKSYVVKLITVAQSLSGDADNDLNNKNYEKALAVYKKSLEKITRAKKEKDVANILDKNLDEIIDKNIITINNGISACKKEEYNIILNDLKTKLDDILHGLAVAKNNGFNVSEENKSAKEIFIELSEAGNSIENHKFSEVDGIFKKCERELYFLNATVKSFDLKSMGSEKPLTPAGQKPQKLSGSFPAELEENYDDAKFIGEGGFAYVFKAKSKKDKRFVAIKIPKEMNEKIGKTFLKEIRIWGDLHHKNIAKLYNANIYPRAYLEIEYVDKGSLEGIKKPVDVEKAAELIYNLLQGLTEAHSKNIYHLDLKPENVLLTLNEEPKITDWGLSKIAKDSKYTAVTGYTLMYAAPELFSPKDFGKADCRTDIFQTGIIFYELVTGKNPFDGDTQQQILMNILMEKPKKPSEINADAKVIDNIIMKCLEKKKEDRYQNVFDMQKDLIEYLKIEYKKSWSESKLKGDLKRSCFYCGKVVTVCAAHNDIENTLKYTIDLKNYARGEFKKDVDDIIEKLKYLMKEKMVISDELQKQINIIIHQIKMGRE